MKIAAFQQLYAEYARPVYRFLLCLTRDETQAEELLQETFFQALQHIDRFEGRCSLYTWLCQIGKNAWFRECRRSRRFSPSRPEELNLPAPSPEDHVIAQDEFQRIRQAIVRLEKPYRNVFILHALGKVRLREIALLYGKTESWARVTFFRARQKIVQEVSE